MSVNSCVQCGAENAPTAKFCNECGSRLEADGATVVRAQAVDDELERVTSALAGKYRVLGRIGEGGMGIVFKAIDLALERTIAIKVIPLESEKDKAFVERFRREARLAARLRHPRIISIHEVGEVGDVHYFTMDFVEGESLRSLVQRRKKLALEDALEIVTEIASAVAHAHGKGIIHRDLKPENIMVDRDGEVFVLDFGLARALQEPGMTQTGMVMGSPMYMSPEQIRGEAVDHRSDIFAIGLILYFCVTGNHLFAAESMTGVIAKHMTMSVPDAIATHPDIPPMLREPLTLMLERDVELRAADMKVVLERLALRRIVAIGGDAVGATTMVSEGQRIDAIPVVEVPVESTGEDEVTAQRKKRLRALLSEL